MSVELGSYVAILMANGSGAYWAELSEWSKLIHAHKQFTEKGIDASVLVVLLNGTEAVFAASNIGELMQSTPESRERQRALNAADKAERIFEDA